jgi:hypothetical protein
MTKIITIQLELRHPDVSRMPYKYVIPEHEPIKLSSGLWLHILRVTDYNDSEPSGDPDIEQEAFKTNQY